MIRPPPRSPLFPSTTLFRSPDGPTLSLEPVYLSRHRIARIDPPVEVCFYIPVNDKNVSGLYRPVLADTEIHDRTVTRNTTICPADRLAIDSGLDIGSCENGPVAQQHRLGRDDLAFNPAIRRHHRTEGARAF